MVNVNIKTTNGGKARKASATRKTTSVARARATVRSDQRRISRGMPRVGELKFHDIDWDEPNADQSAGVISNTSSLVLIGQGVTEKLRIGRKAVIESIGWRGSLKLALSAGAALQTPETVRLMIVHDQQCNGAAPTITGGDGVLASANYQAFNDLVNKGRFKTLYDQFFTMNSVAASGDGAVNDSAEQDINFDFFKKLEIPIEYSGTASPSVITELRSNNIFGLMITKTASGITSLDSKFRFRFRDS